MSQILDVEELPSAEVSIENADQRMAECEEYLQNGQWTQFVFLFKIISQFIELLDSDVPRSISKRFEEIGKKGKELLLKNLEISTEFEDFRSWLQSLSDIVPDRRKLWDIIHQEATPAIKITFKQSQMIAAQFFPPHCLFEFGVKPFLECNLVDFTNIANEEALIDIFYALAGFVRACQLEKSYETQNEDFVECIKKLLTYFVKLPDFDPHRFVWVVEAINSNLRIVTSKLKEVVMDVISSYISKEDTRKPLQKLYKICVFTTSPFMKNFTLLKQGINTVYRLCVEEQRMFIRRYIFASYPLIKYDTDERVLAPTDPAVCWKLYVTNLSQKLDDKPEIPKMILIDLLDDSLILFEGIFSQIQPTRERAPTLRADIFLVAEVIAQYYPEPIKQDTLKRVWYLLYIAVITGSSEESLNNILPTHQQIPKTPLLGLEHTSTDFNSYPLALGYLSKLFEDEKENYPDMVKFIRAKYR